MVKLDPRFLRSLVAHDGTLFVSDQITRAVERCLTLASSHKAIEEAGEKLEAHYKKYREITDRAPVLYDTPVVLDAYSVFYLPRNSLVARIALLCCSYHEAFARLPRLLKVLDIGSGTGGVVLGLLDLFGNEPLAGVELKITSVDGSQQALDKQSSLIDELQHICLPRTFSRRFIRADLNDIDTLKAKVEGRGSYDIVFAANLLTELTYNSAEKLVDCVAGWMGENSLFVSVEPQRPYTVAMKAKLITWGHRRGLWNYYPCPSATPCDKLPEKCFASRDDSFDCRPVIHEGMPFNMNHNLRALWTILSKRKVSIYDVLQKQHPELVWGIVMPWGNDNAKNLEFCTVLGRREAKHTTSEHLISRRFEYGQIIGFSPGTGRASKGWDVLKGFFDLNETIEILR